MSSFSELLTILAMIGTCFVFLYNEMKNVKSEVKEDLANIQMTRKIEIEQSKQDILRQIGELQQTFKNDLFGHKQDIKIDFNDIKNEIKKDFKDLQKELITLSERLARIETSLAFLRDDYEPPIKKDN